MSANGRQSKSNRGFRHGWRLGNIRETGLVWECGLGYGFDYGLEFGFRFGRTRSSSIDHDCFGLSNRARVSVLGEEEAKILLIGSPSNHEGSSETLRGEYPKEFEAKLLLGRITT